MGHQRHEWEGMMNPNVGRMFTGLKLHVRCLSRRHHICDPQKQSTALSFAYKGSGKQPLDDFVSLIHHKCLAATGFLGSVSPDNGRRLIPSWLELRMRVRTRKSSLALLQRLCS